MENTHKENVNDNKKRKLYWKETECGRSILIEEKLFKN